MVNLASAGNGLFQGVLWGWGLSLCESQRNKPQGSTKPFQTGVTRCRWCCCGISGGVNWDLLPTLHSRLKACCLIHACSNTRTQTHKTRQVKTTNYCPWGEKEGRNVLQTFVKLLNMVLQDPQIHVVWEEIWSTYMWRYVSFEVQSMPKAME